MLKKMTIMIVTLMALTTSIWASSGSSSPQTMNQGSSSNIHQTKLDLNKADAESLQMLPGIGSTLAKRIVSYRQNHGDFKSLDDLKKVKGLSTKTVHSLAHLVKVKTIQYQS